MTTPPIIEPIPENPALTGGSAPYDRPPGFVPYTRDSWMKRNPGVAVTIAIALTAGASYLAEGIWSLVTATERAERQLSINAGDQKEAEARVKSDEKLRKLIRENGKATARNGAAIGTMATHALEDARYNRLLLRDIAGRDSQYLEIPGPLRDAETALRKLPTRH